MKEKPFVATSMEFKTGQYALGKSIKTPIMDATLALGMVSSVSAISTQSISNETGENTNVFL